LRNANGKAIVGKVRFVVEKPAQDTLIDTGVFDLPQKPFQRFMSEKPLDHHSLGRYGKLQAIVSAEGCYQKHQATRQGQSKENIDNATEPQNVPPRFLSPGFHR
jgi:hypothetical protein